MKTAYRTVVLLAAALTGCDGWHYAPIPGPAPLPAVGTHFDPKACGTVTGTVRWDGPLPDCPPVIVPQFNLSGVGPAVLPNPNAVLPWPDGGIFSAVVYLRGVEPARSKPWDLPSVVVEADDLMIRVRQGNGQPERVGFVQAGSAQASSVVQLQSKGTGYVGVRGRGAGFFSHVFPPDGQPVKRTFHTPGRVELTSASGQFWAAAELFVSHTPYIARPAPGGRFTFTHVPAGTYELVCWHPNWHPGPTELDPETGAPARRRYAPGVELVQPVTVTTGQSASADFQFRTDAFVPASKQ